MVYAYKTPQLKMNSCYLLGQQQADGMDHGRQGGMRMVIHSNPVSSGQKSWMLVEQSVTTTNIDHLNIASPDDGVDGGGRQREDAIDINQETTAARHTSRQSPVDKVHLVSHLRRFPFIFSLFIRVHIPEN